MEADTPLPMDVIRFFNVSEKYIQDQIKLNKWLFCYLPQALPIWFLPVAGWSFVWGYFFTIPMGLILYILGTSGIPVGLSDSYAKIKDGQIHLKVGSDDHFNGNRALRLSETIEDLWIEKSFNWIVLKNPVSGRVLCSIPYNMFEGLYDLLVSIQSELKETKERLEERRQKMEQMKNL